MFLSTYPYLKKIRLLQPKITSLKTNQKRRKMKKRILLILTLASSLIGLNCTSAHAEYCPYVSGTGSIAWHDDYELELLPFRVDHKTGGGGSLAIGIIMHKWRLEVEGLARYNKIDSINLTDSNNQAIDSLGMSGYTRDFAIMLNGFYDLHIYDCVSLYLGIGLGISFNKIKGDAATPSFRFHIHDESTAFALQLMLGLSYDISERVTLFTGYRLFSRPAPAYIKDIAVSQSLDFGLRFKL